MYAACMSQRAAGTRSAPKIIQQLASTPKIATESIQPVTSTQKSTVKQLTPSEALSVFVEADLTRRQYEIIQAAAKNVYPCYSVLKKVKKDCYPSEQSITVTETCAEVNLQDLLHHTSMRLCKYLEEVIMHITVEEKKHLELIGKWGCDGSQQPQFKQKFQHTTDSDESIFQTSFVPLRLLCTINKQKKTLWQNPVPSSTRFCRPIRIRFVRETNDITNEEMQYMEDKIKKLKKTELKDGSGDLLYIRYTLLPTMVDTKVSNAVTATSSSMRCYICGQTSADFNKLNKQNIENPVVLRFGLSILHARIRFFESVLHLSYKIPLGKWQARSDEEKQLVRETKKRIQDSLRTEMGLLADLPRQGFGNSNDGNTSRRFFADPEAASRITGVDINIITKFKVTLEALSSGYRIDVKKITEYAEETAKLYVQLYEWHPMSPTIHKILLHGATVIEHALLPIGQLSEEAAEARNKHLRQYRLHSSRKFSRAECLKDVLHRLLLTSDPVLSSSRPRRWKRSKPFASETLKLLLPELPIERGPNAVTENNGLCETENEEHGEEDEDEVGSSSEESD